MNRWIKGPLVLIGTAMVVTEITFRQSDAPLAIGVSVAVMGVILFAKWSGNPAPDKTRYGDTIRGTQVSDKKKRGSKSPTDQITIGGIPMDRDVEPQHFLGVGAPGTGKTVVNEVFLDVIRGRGQRAIVYDSTGEFVSHFYRPDKDVILSPIDKRSEHEHDI